MMIEARVDIQAENYYSCEITRTLPVRINLVSINGPVGFGIIEALDGREDTLKEYAKIMTSTPSIIDFRVTHSEPTLYWTRAEHEMKNKSIHETILESGSMNRLPIIVEEGFQKHSILSPSQDSFRQVILSLQNRFDKVRIRRLTHTPGSAMGHGLTKRQYDAFKLAYESGYYKIPRAVKLEDISLKLGIKRVALQERLRRIQQKVFADFYDSYF
jgi:predicted DNA binding protein